MEAQKERDCATESGDGEREQKHLMGRALEER